ncbi:MAG: Sua5/YciO/YrdC/YwlC family protein [Bacteroidota bacterium]
MQTSTNYSPSMHPYLPPLGSEALTTIHRGGLVLLPTANLWQVVTHLHDTAAIDRLLALCPPSSFNRPELLFYDLDLMRSWVPNLHPKLETLLSYHRRPLTLLIEGCPKAPASLRDVNGRVAIRLIQDSFCYRLGEDLELPLVAALAQAPGTQVIPNRFGVIRSDVLRGVDYVVQRRQKDILGHAPAVVITIDDEDEIVFL